MATQQDIFAAGNENRPPMLNKDNYIQWSSRMLRYLKTKPNGRLMIKSITEGPFKPRQVQEQGDPNCVPPLLPYYRDITEAEYSVEDKLQIEADDHAINLIQLGLGEDIYAAVDSCESAFDMWERVRRLCYGTDIGMQDMENKLLTEFEKFKATPGEQIESYYRRFCTLINNLTRHNLTPKPIVSNIKFINNLEEEDWGRYVTIVNQTKNLHELNYDQLYDFLKQNQKEVNALRAERLAKKHDPLAFVATTNSLPMYAQSSSISPYPSSSTYQPSPYHPSSSSTHTFVQQQIPQQLVTQQVIQPQQEYQLPEFNADNSEATAALSNAFAFLTKAFNVRYSTPTNNNQRISSNTRNKQFAQPGMNMGNQGQMVGVIGNQQGYAPGIQMGNQMGQNT